VVSKVVLAELHFNALASIMRDCNRNRHVVGAKSRIGGFGQETLLLRKTACAGE
jgi:hypothetical protein